MATAFTSTSTALIADTFSSRNSVSINNTGAGTVLVVCEGNSSATPTVSASNVSFTIPPYTHFDSPPGTVGKWWGLISSGTAYVTEIANRLN
jgi:hypothetical protein